MAAAVALTHFAGGHCRKGEVRVRVELTCLDGSLKEKFDRLQLRVRPVSTGFLPNRNVHYIIYIFC